MGWSQNVMWSWNRPSDELQVRHMYRAPCMVWYEIVAVASHVESLLGIHVQSSRGEEQRETQYVLTYASAWC